MKVPWSPIADRDRCAAKGIHERGPTCVEGSVWLGCVVNGSLILVQTASIEHQGEERQHHQNDGGLHIDELSIGNSVGGNAPEPRPA